ncbi:MAG: DNA polymerase III subunit [Phycisphaeraceae bacterium]|nr:DNA polymerase III subunit [Phycisphaeraceae bacterium]
MKTIRGQQRAVKMLSDQIAGDRLHHAYIFHGPSGVGKFTTALAFARLLLKAENDTHPDLHVIHKELAAFSDIARVRDQKQRNIPVDVLRNRLLELVYRKATVPGGRKVFIIDEAELIDATGQNLLLKTLEEPPEGTIVILVTASEDRLLPTVRSRCQRVGFDRLSDMVVATWLDEQANDLDPQQRQAVLTFAQGSLGRARLALDYDLARWVERVVPALDNLAHGRSDSQFGSDVHNFINQFAEAWVADHANASKEAANQQAVSLMWSLLAEHAARRINELAGDAAATEPWLSAIDALEQSGQLLGSNVNLSLVCDHTAAQLAECFSG